MNSRTFPCPLFLGDSFKHSQPSNDLVLKVCDDILTIQWQTDGLYKSAFVLSMLCLSPVFTIIAFTYHRLSTTSMVVIILFLLIVVNSIVAIARMQKISRKRRGILCDVRRTVNGYFLWGANIPGMIVCVVYRTSGLIVPTRLTRDSVGQLSIAVHANDGTVEHVVATFKVMSDVERIIAAIECFGLRVERVRCPDMTLDQFFDLSRQPRHSNVIV
jgi:ABC-type multidrug transport system fused ATPase/permease subunit